jgi:MerR family copper efflux transcriptional regulator
VNIGEAAAASGVSAKMIRHYEMKGLLPRPRRSAGGYRVYGDADVRTLRFIRRARDAGLGLADIARLVSLWQDRARPAREVKALVARHLETLAHRRAELAAIESALSHLVAHCHGDDRPDCPILDAFDTSPAGTVANPDGRVPGPRRSPSARERPR